jgi:hypothetical protein
MTLPIAETYQNWYGESAVRIFVGDLMRGDPATLQVGYTRENAIIAAAEAFGIERSEVEEEMNKNV